MESDWDCGNYGELNMPEKEKKFKDSKEHKIALVVRKMEILQRHRERFDRRIEQLNQKKQELEGGV